MKKVLKGIVAFSVLLTAAFAPVSALACSTGCASVPVACPTADPCAKPEFKCPETIYFANDSACEKHIKISYRGKGIFGSIFKRTLHITLGSGEVYAFNYDNATTWNKKVTIVGYHLNQSHKIQSGQVWLSSALENAHGMPFGASPKARTSIL